MTPALFSLAIDSLVKNLRSILNPWYLDDGSLAGPGNLFLSDVKECQRTWAPAYNPKKCELLVTGSGDSQKPFVEAIYALLPGTKIFQLEECELLGAPLSKEALPRALAKKIETISTLLDRLLTLSSHVVLFLLKNCLATPKLIYLLRCSPTWQEPDLLQDLDSIIRSGLETLLNVSINGKTWIQASLPVSRPEVDWYPRCSRSLSSRFLGLDLEHLGSGLPDFGWMAIDTGHSKRGGTLALVSGKW